MSLNARPWPWALLVLSLLLATSAGCMRQYAEEPDAPALEEGSRISSARAGAERKWLLKRRGVAWVLADARGRMVAKASPRRSEDKVLLRSPEGRLIGLSERIDGGLRFTDSREEGVAVAPVELIERDGSLELRQGSKLLARFESAPDAARDTLSGARVELLPGVTDGLRYFASGSAPEAAKPDGAPADDADTMLDPAPSALPPEAQAGAVVEAESPAVASGEVVEGVVVEGAGPTPTLTLETRSGLTPLGLLLLTREDLEPWARLGLAVHSSLRVAVDAPSVAEDVAAAP